MWYSRYITNIIVAMAVSLVVNLSYFMVLILNVDTSQQPSNQPERGDLDPRISGVIHIAEDGSYGNIIINTDTIYVTRNRIRQYSLQDGDMLQFITTMSRRHNMANPELNVITRVNGRPVAPLIVTDARDPLVLAQQILYYFILSFVIIVVLSGNRNKAKTSVLSRILRLIIVLGFALVVLYFLAPEIMPRRGSGGIPIRVLGRYPFDFMLLLRWSFALIVSLLYGFLSISIGQRQRIKIENERLKTENITTKYNVLMNQVNPHFFFNSLNSLSMLVREGDSDRSLTYIDQLSYTFRYILQSGEQKLTTLSEEMRFVEAYIYLFEIRYGEKLTFDINIEESYKNWLIPPLSLQPLLDNAVKHNIITTARPFTISIKIEDGVMVVSNEIRPKIERDPSTGIGIDNLRKRWILLAKRRIVVNDTNGIFTVKLPLINPKDEDSNS
ncbi:MAG: histidine kinase [Rikenellaceae bacterium]